MIAPGIPRHAVATAVLRALVVAEAAAFLVAALLHLGVRIPLGPVVLAEPVIVPAVVVEGLCGLFLGASASALLTRQTWAWGAAVAAHLFAACGVLLGMWALAAGRGPRTELNDLYHRTILLVLLVGLALLWTPGVRAALRGARRAA